MGLKSTIAKWAAAIEVPKIYRDQQNAVAIQHQLLVDFLHQARNTHFGEAHHFSSIKTYREYTQQVAIKDYEGFKDYIELIANGKEDVLWPGLPLYFCKSSGTTSGTKYIPATKAQINAMIAAARQSLLLYVHETGKSEFFDHKMIFLQGSPLLDKYGVIPAGRLSGIVANHVPFYVAANRMPSFEVNCIDDWEEKVEAISRETVQLPMSLISGIPPWVVMYFERLQRLSGKEKIKDIFPKFSVFAYGGVSYEPYRAKIEEMIGFPIDSIETYPASEGFIAFQDKQKEPGLLLHVNGGIFYEFVQADEVHLPNAKAVSLADVALNVNYALILTTNAGLWRYSLGDTVRFVSLQPYRIVVTGRIKHFISAFGEHVIGEEVEYALMQSIREMNGSVTEFSVAPQVNPAEGLPYHEWCIEFSETPSNLLQFATRIDVKLQERNSYYFDLRQGGVLSELKITPLKQNAFVELMKREGKLGGQNKVPRLMNDRTIADKLLLYTN
jgi:phenylacetate-coenzyme A ligase PaaK-like adenylate-forming protein